MCIVQLVIAEFILWIHKILVWNKIGTFFYFKYVELNFMISNVSVYLMVRPFFFFLPLLTCFDVDVFEDFVNTHDLIYYSMCVFILSHVATHVYLWTDLRIDSYTIFTGLRKIVNFYICIGCYHLGKYSKRKKYLMFSIF